MSFEELAKEVAGRLMPSGEAPIEFCGVGIDSRTIKPGELFIAIRGERNDGHKFIGQALSRGAAGIMVDSRFEQVGSFSKSASVIVVKDTHEAMIQLAHNYRKTTEARIIGITGSNGKTTTKEFTHALLKTVEKDAYKSPGNFNNLFGAPLALLAMPQKTKAAVMEMGISTKGEMTRLTNLVGPNVCVITNVGPSHLEFLSTVQDVARAKLEMITASPEGTPLVVNGDDEMLMCETEKVHKKTVTFGIVNEASIRPVSIQPTEFGNRVTIDDVAFDIRMFGRHHVYNLLAAYAAVKTLGYRFGGKDTSKINLSPAPMRGEIIERSGIRIINDAYNSNPVSVKAGLEAFNETPSQGRRVLILGDMLELGQRSEKYHRELGNTLISQEFSFAIVVGEWSRAVIEGARQAGVSVSKLRSFRNSAEAAAVIGEIIRSGDVVYVKGSRGVGLEKIIEKIGGGEVE